MPARRSRPNGTIGPTGKPLTVESLPPPDTKRWVIRRKAEVGAAVRNGLIGLDEACERYRLSAEEFLNWEQLITAHGLRGLMVTRLQEHRQSEREDNPAERLSRDGMSRANANERSALPKSDCWSGSLSDLNISDLPGTLQIADQGVRGQPEAHRLKLPSRPSPIRLSTSPRKPKPAPMAKRVIKVKPKPILRAARPRNDSPACLWPIGDPGEADFHFCGAETVPGKPYCPEHCARAYVARTRDDHVAA